MMASVNGSLPEKRWDWVDVMMLFGCCTGVGIRRAVWMGYPLPRVVQMRGYLGLSRRICGSWPG